MYGEAAACEAVIVVVPAPTTTTTPVEALIVATSVLELVKLNAPLLGDDGGAIVNWVSPKVLAGATNVPKLGVAEVTVKVAVILDETYRVFAACVARTCTEPGPATVIIPAEVMVAIAASLTPSTSTIL